MIFFTADLHFGHANIIKYCHRPYVNVDDMNNALIANWNSDVKPEDDIYILGDFAWDKTTYLTMLRRLNGRKHLLVGNHDPRQLRTSSDFDSEFGRYPVLHDGSRLKVNGHKFWLSHFPFEEWPRGYIHLHGHSHGNLKRKHGRFDVGVDCWCYSPVSLDQIIRRLK